MRSVDRLCLLFLLLKKRRRHSVYRNRATFPRIVTCRLRLKRMYAMYRLVLHHRHLCARVKHRKWWVRPIFADHDTHGAWNALIPLMRRTDLEKYYNFMRMYPEKFDELLELVSPYLQKRSWRKSICPGERLAITLRYLASGDSMVSLSYLFRVSDECISAIALETTTVIWHVLKSRVFEPISEDMWMRVAAEFEVLWNFPHCLGAIDGKHVTVQAFARDGSKYFCYKKCHSVILMAVADAKHKFIVVDAGACGRRGDGNVFHRSTFSRLLRNGSLKIPPACPVDGVDGDIPFLFVGDSAFEHSSKIATPFKGHFLPVEEALYNYRLSRARRVVENAFGILCSRYRIFRKSILGSKSLVKSIILACVALHNWHLIDEESVPLNRRKYRPEGYADYEREDGTFVYGRWRNEDPEMEQTVFNRLIGEVDVQVNCENDITGDEVAERLIEYFVENPLPWQWRKINAL